MKPFLQLMFIVICFGIWVAVREDKTAQRGKVQRRIK